MIKKFYSSYIFPWWMNKLMSRKSFQIKRKEVLSSAKGKILEIGLGTGLNLPHYPKNVKNITTVDVNPGMNNLAKKRSKISGIKIDHHVITAEKLPFADETFDTVVSTWTFCSIPNIEEALKEIHRVLKKEGKLLFIEHGISRNLKIAKWQNKFTPISKVLACGCHLNRDIKKILEKSPLKITELTQFEMKEMARFAKPTYQGIAVKK